MEKTYYRMDNIGKTKYSVRAHDGVSINNDGSPFFGIAIFKNKRKLNKHITDLKHQGYVER